MKQLALYPQPPTLSIEEAVPLGRDLDPGCTLCSLHEKVRTVCLPAEGIPGGLLVVGESPQAEDDRKSVSFSSPTGAWVRNEIAKLWSGPVVYDNAIRCFPGSREVTEKAIAACRPYLAKTLVESAPTRVLLFGSDALKSVIGRTFHAFSSRRGYAYMPSMNVPVFMLIPPPQALRNRYVRAWLEDDIRWALTATPPHAPTDGLVMYVTTPEEAEDACFELSTGAELVYDTETFGSPHDPEFKITTLAINVVGEHHAYVWDEHALKNPAMSEPLKRLLEDPRVPKGGQNIKYDALAARASFGARTRPMTFDVRLIRKMLEADAHAALEVMQTRVGMGGGKDEAGDYVKEAIKEIRKAVKDRQPAKPSAKTGKIPVKKPYTFPWRHEMQAAEYATMLDRVEAGVTPKKYAFAFMPEDVRGVYCARDAVSTGLLKDVFYKDLEQRPELIKLWETVTVPLMHAITEIEWNGIKMSIPALQQLTTAMTTKETEYRQQLAQYVWPDFNPSASSPDTGKMLFNQPTDDPPGLGLKVRRTTPTGKAGTSVSDIEEINHPVIPILLGLRKVMHFRSQYADGLGSALRGDGRIHTYYKIDGTVTGRPSTEDPNLLNVPRASSPEGKMCRDLFVPEDGWELVEGDYNQIELRVAAFLSEDDVMINVFKSGYDFHLETARMIAPYFKFDPASLTKDHPLRSRAKIVNFGVLYGKDAYGLAMELDIPKKEAQQLVDAILGKFRKLALWIQNQLKLGRQTGWTRTWWDGADARYRPLWQLGGFDDDARQGAERSTWNTTIQGTATEFTNASLGAIQKWIEEDDVPAKLVLTVYDSIVAEVRCDAVEEYIYGSRRIMESWPAKGMPIVADFKRGFAWGSLVDVPRVA